jgi:two-component system, cell cycle sensor histidine kinase and response regulator CckA
MGTSFVEGTTGKPNHRLDLPDASFNNQSMITGLLESASQAILAVDRSGRIVLANRRAEELFDYSRGELLGASIELLISENRQAAHQRRLEEYFERPRMRPMGIGMELAGRRRDGSEIPIEVSLNAIETPEGIFAIAFIADITQRKRLEEQLIHAQKMEAVGRLAGGVAHDFNNMLTVISGYTRMILDELAPQDPLREYAEEVAKAAERAGAVTNQLLSFSRRQLIQPRIIDVNAAILQIEKMLRRLLGEDIQLSLDMEANLPHILADPNQIEQAVVNLAVNSRDAMPEGGQIFIKTAQVHLDEDYVRIHLGVKPGDYVMVAITDTGQGMTPEVRQRIFEPFFTTKERGKGTGLGLATVYGMVKQSGGDVWVYSEPEKGSTFRLYFPKAAEQPPAAVVRESEPAKVKRGETVLVVEDEKPVRELTVRILQQLGYSVLSAASGREALAICSSFAGRIALLLTDVVMPEMSGRQVADAVLRARPELKVLYVSGYTEHAVIHHGVASGVQFLAKPFSRDALAKKMAAMLSAAE